MDETEIAAFVARTIERGELDATTGEGLVQAFEQAWAKMMGGGHALALCNGTAALFTALLAAGAGPGDEVVCPPLAPPYALAPILHCGAKPVFADVDPRTLTIDPGAALALAGPRTRAILAVDLFGHPADIASLVQTAHASGITVIEDCAQALGATCHGLPAGAKADFAVFSLHTTKNLPAGEGGVLWTRDRRLYERALVVGMHPVRLAREISDRTLRRYLDTGRGYNFRPHPLGIALALARLKSFPADFERRQKAGRYLDEKISQIPGLEPAFVAPGCTHAYNLHPVFYHGQPRGAGSLDDYVRRLRKAGLDADVLWPLAYDLPLFQEKGFPPPHCPAAENLESTVFFFGWGGYTGASHDDLERVARLLAAALQS